MRRFALLFPFFTSACGATNDKPVFFDESAVVFSPACTTVDALNARGSSVADVTEANDSTIAILYDTEREIVRLDSDLRVTATVSFDRLGPRGIRQPASVAVTADRYFVADGGAMAVKVLDARGRDAGLIRLGFVPHRIRAAGPAVYVTPMVFANNPSSMLVAISGGKPQLLDVPIARYEDLGIAAFASLGSMAAFPDGRVVVMHEFVVPFGYSSSSRNGQSSIRRFSVPLPGAMRSNVDRLPKPPISETNIGDMLAVALTASPNVKTGGMFYLTRTGRRMKGHWEKMVVEVDSAFNYLRSFPAPGRPQHMVFFAARSSILLVDDEAQWHECKLT